MNTVQAPAKELTMLFFRPPILIRPPSQIGKHPPHHKDYADNIIMYYILNIYAVIWNWSFMPLLTMCWIFFINLVVLASL